MWSIPVIFFALGVLSSVLADLIRAKESDPRHRPWEFEKDPYFNRDYARPPKRTSRAAA
jgi:hypothetical protein